MWADCWLWPAAAVLASPETSGSPERELAGEVRTNAVAVEASLRRPSESFPDRMFLPPEDVMGHDTCRTSRASINRDSPTNNEQAGAAHWHY